MKRLLTPSLNPAGLTATLAALYAIGAGIWHVYHHHAAIDPAVITAALTTFAAAFTRQAVTPVADPRDGNGQPLGPPTMRQVAAAAARVGLEVRPQQYAAMASNVTPSPAAPPDVPRPASLVSPGGLFNPAPPAAPPDVHDQPQPPGA